MYQFDAWPQPACDRCELFANWTISRKLYQHLQMISKMERSLHVDQGFLTRPLSYRMLLRTPKYPIELISKILLMADPVNLLDALNRPGHRIKAFVQLLQIKLKSRRFFIAIDHSELFLFQFQASGSGDTTVRFWDLTTETPQFECKGHRQYVLALAWASNGLKVLTHIRTIEIYSQLVKILNL